MARGMEKSSFKSSAWVLRIRRPPSRSSAMASGSSRRSFLAGISALPALAMQRSGPQSYWTKEYWAEKGAVRLYLYRKRRSTPKQGEPALPVLFLVHGSSLSGRSTFDLAVPGGVDYSMMNAFAGYGFDVWTMDFEGYGKSSRDRKSTRLNSSHQIISY